MENYNPRQNTRMRWKDARELEKFKFISGEFDFGSEVLEEASKHEPWSKITNIFVNDKLKEPILLYDISNNTPYIGYKDSDTILLNNLDGNTNYTVELIYNQNEDELTINKAEDELLSADNVKTLFGNQSIIGQGNIDLYRHQLTLNYDGEYETVSLIVYSSSNLNVDSLQDLTTLLKPNSNTLYFGNTTNSITPYTFQIIYDNNVWKTGSIREGEEKPNNNITSVSDIVTTI